MRSLIGFLLGVTAGGYIATVFGGEGSAPAGRIGGDAARS